MAIKFVVVRCPACGAELPMEEGRTQMFCAYCGVRVIMSNENEYIYRHVDDAQIKQAETERIVKMKQIELVEKKRASQEKEKVWKIGASIAMGIIGTIFMLIGIIGGEATGDDDSAIYIFMVVGLFMYVAIAYIWGVYIGKEEDDDLGDQIKVPSAISNYESKNFAAIEAIFKSAGFTNVRCIGLNDLTTGLIKKPGMVSSITINGHEVSCGGRKFGSESAVIILYHSFTVR